MDPREERIESAEGRCTVGPKGRHGIGRRDLTCIFCKKIFITAASLDKGCYYWVDGAGEALPAITRLRGPHVGIGGAPTRATTLPDDPKLRKQYPVASGVLDYFPDALAAVAHVSWQGNEQHNPGQPLHWARGKSSDESDAIMRHMLQRGDRDTDGQRHSAKLAWRALALLQKEIEEEKV